MNCGPNAIDAFRPALSHSSIHLEAMAGVRFEMVKYMTATVFVWLTTASQVLAHRPGGGGHGGHGGGGHAAPEIDGPAGVAAVALLVSAGIIAYNRYKKK